MKAAMTFVSILFVAWISGAAAHADCSINLRTSVELDVQICERVVPENVPEIRDYAAQFEKGMSPPATAKVEAKRLMDGYRGAKISGRVISGKRCDPDATKPSDCTRASKAGAAAVWDLSKFYFFQNTSPTVCGAYPMGKIVHIVAERPCCDGGGWSPCLFRRMK